jgi:hypothetical protein
VQEYLLASQDPQPENQLHVRTGLRDIAPIVAAVKREVESLDPDQPIGRITTMDEPSLQVWRHAVCDGVVRRVCRARAGCLRAWAFTA